MYVVLFFFISNCMVYLFYFIRDNDTPPNTPRRARIAAQRNEQDERTMDSPQRRRIPPVPPLYFNAPAPAPNAVSLIFHLNLLQSFKILYQGTNGISSSFCPTS